VVGWAGITSMWPYLFGACHFEIGNWLSRVLVLTGFAFLTVHSQPALAQEIADEALIKALQKGGYNIYFRHAATDWSQEDFVGKDGDWVDCDPTKMRQLSDKGRGVARRIGDAMRALQIPIGTLLSSEYCRAAETARLMNIGPVTTTRDIMNMRAAHFVGGRDTVILRARRVLSDVPPSGTNVVIVGHGNLMRAATNAYPDEGGGGVFIPVSTSKLGFELVVQLSSDDWVRLAARFAGPQ
jgi:phosphohistidine phosphatase SixA